MKRNFNSILEADNSKLKVRSKQEIVDRISELEKEYEYKKYKQSNMIDIGYEIEAEKIESELKLVANEVRVLDWVLGIS